MTKSDIDISLQSTAILQTFGENYFMGIKMGLRININECFKLVLLILKIKMATLANSVVDTMAGILIECQ